MTVIPLPQRMRHLAKPLVMFVDLQEEYVASGRAFSLRDAGDCLANCESLLAVARESEVAIAHFRQVNASTFFNRESTLSQWIERFRPKSHEMVFERDMPSCYCNASFENFMAQVACPTIIFAGLTGEQSCLATAIDAAHRGHRAIFVHDASASQALGARSEVETHEIIADIIGLYASTMSTRDVISHLKELERPSWSRIG